MTWIDKILHSYSGSGVVNDSKTPSGRSHVGSLRGVLIHDAVVREGQHRGLDLQFMYGCDDMDPVDEIPFGSDLSNDSLGVPLCNAPAPNGEKGTSMSALYFGEFAEVLAALGVGPDYYRMSEIYRSGQLDFAINRFLSHADTVRNIYLRVSHSERPEGWLPFQPICEACGRIGTTYATDYDGDTVAYECQPDLVEWATGCGTVGRISPFGGNGKLPWKLEWAAKWMIFDVSIEGAGKDHMAASGSHQIAAALSREILSRGMPHPIPYEFLTLDGAKMSSSKGVGMSAADLCHILPPELVRYLILRTQPKRAANFELSTAGINKAFAEYERLWRATESGSATDAEAQLFRLCSVNGNETAQVAPQFSPPFDTVLSVSLQPHIDIEEHLTEIGADTLTEADQRWLTTKQNTVQAWVEAAPEAADGFAVIDDPSEQIAAMTEAQISFMNLAGNKLSVLGTWNAADIQSEVFDATREVGIEPRDAFTAIYQIVFGKNEGPRAGEFFEFYGKERTVQRLSVSK